MQQWLPLSTATFQSIIEVIPPPPFAQAIRLPYMLHTEKAKAAAASGGLKAENELERGLYECDQGEGAEVVAYVSKMFAVRKGDLPEYKPKEITAEEMRARGREERERRAALMAERQAKGESLDGQPLPEDLAKPLESLSLENSQPSASKEPAIDDSDSEVLLGFSRIFSSTLHRGTFLLAILPKFDPSLPASHPHNAKHIVPIIASDLYMMMGRELVSVDSVPAGHVCAIGGLDKAVPRSATLWAPDAKGVEEGSGREVLVNLAGVGIGTSAIVRVALEPENPSKPLQLDPSESVILTPSGRRYAKVNQRFTNFEPSRSLCRISCSGDRRACHHHSWRIASRSTSSFFFRDSSSDTIFVLALSQRPS